jgi:alkylated DNA nucleotide flippase Atl1
MSEIRLTRHLMQDGYAPDELRRMERDGRLVHIRRGAWAAADGLPAEDTAESRHLLLLRAVAAQVQPGAVLSHGSAAVLLGLPVWPRSIERVHLTRNRSTGAKRRRDVEIHAATLPTGHVTEVDGMPVTTLPRTGADLARLLPFDQAVAAGDRAAAQNLDFGHLEDVLRSMEQWPGVRQARRVADFLDGRAESAGESVSRVRVAELGLPSPIPQYEVYDADGTMIARADFAWPDRRTIGEFDGRVKYGALLKSGQRPEDVVYAEKLREDALRDAGWQVVRWIWADLARPLLIQQRLLRAFARAGRPL